MLCATPALAQALTARQEAYSQGWQRVFKEHPSVFAKMQECLRAQRTIQECGMEARQAVAAIQAANAAAAVALQAQINEANRIRQQQALEQQNKAAQDAAQINTDNQLRNLETKLQRLCSGGAC